ncbi:hypothetical protein [Salinigranum rubrum]|uniref:hypothetical protein n=1 Tax=Salinigranum rubrum TaxID=755307 RepID=UPI0013A58712|nr:hypothetical protein [Salinigranum rubrum]
MAESTRICHTTPFTDGTAIVEADPTDFVLINSTSETLTSQITVTRLPEDVTARPPADAPHEILPLSGEPAVFSTTIELSAGDGRPFRCTGVRDSSTADMREPPDEFQVAVDVQDGPSGAFDWRAGMGALDIDLTGSSIDFSFTNK